MGKLMVPPCSSQHLSAGAQLLSPAAWRQFLAKKSKEKSAFDVAVIR